MINPVTKVLNEIEEASKIQNLTKKELSPESEEDLAVCFRKYDNSTGEGKKELDGLVRDVVCGVEE